MIKVDQCRPFLASTKYIGESADKNLDLLSQEVRVRVLLRRTNESGAIVHEV